MKWSNCRKWHTTVCPNRSFPIFTNNLCSTEKISTSKLSLLKMFSLLYLKVWKSTYIIRKEIKTGVLNGVQNSVGYCFNWLISILTDINFTALKEESTSYCCNKAWILYSSPTWSWERGFEHWWGALWCLPVWQTKKSCILGRGAIWSQTMYMVL